MEIQHTHDVDSTVVLQHKLFHTRPETNVVRTCQKAGPKRKPDRLPSIYFLDLLKMLGKRKSLMVISHGRNRLEKK